MAVLNLTDEGVCALAEKGCGQRLISLTLDSFVPLCLFRSLSSSFPLFLFLIPFLPLFLSSSVPLFLFFLFLIPLLLAVFFSLFLLILSRHDTVLPNLTDASLRSLAEQGCGKKLKTLRLYGCALLPSPFLSFSPLLCCSLTINRLAQRRRESPAMGSALWLHRDAERSCLFCSWRVRILVSLDASRALARCGAHYVVFLSFFLLLLVVVVSQSCPS